MAATVFHYYAAGAQASAALEAAPSLVAGGFLTPDTPVWLPGTAEWLTAATCPALAHLDWQLAPPPLPAPPAEPQPSKKRIRFAGEAEPAAPRAAAPPPAEGEGVDADDADDAGDGADGDDGDDDGGGDDDDSAGEAGGAAAAAQGSAGSAAGGAGRAKRKRAPRKRRARAPPPSCWVYVTGLPPDATAEELAAHCKRAGIIREDYATGRPKVKLYTDAASGAAKGDASVCFLQAPSVELAVALLDGAPLRPRPTAPPEACWPLAVQPAVFAGGAEEEEEEGGGGGGGGGGAAAPAQPQGPAAAAAAAIRAASQRALLSWAEGDEGQVAGAGARGAEPLKIVQLENLYDAGEAAAAGDSDAFFRELEEDLVPEVERCCGALQKITFFPRRGGGLAVIKFRAAPSATSCITHFNGRHFGGRRIACRYWDGEDFSRAGGGAGGGGGEGAEGQGGEEDAEAAEARRIEAFGQWLEQQQ